MQKSVAEGEAPCVTAVHVSEPMATVGVSSVVPKLEPSTVSVTATPSMRPLVGQPAVPAPLVDGQPRTSVTNGADGYE